jgi:hypothetical protein
LPTLVMAMNNTPTIVDKLEDLIKQATTERSHYYVASLALETKEFIHRLCAACERLKRINYGLTDIILGEARRYSYICEVGQARRMRKALKTVSDKNEDFDEFLKLVDTILKQLDGHSRT